MSSCCRPGHRTNSIGLIGGNQLNRFGLMGIGIHLINERNERSEKITFIRKESKDGVGLMPYFKKFSYPQKTGTMTIRWIG